MIQLVRVLGPGVPKGLCGERRIDKNLQLIVGHFGGKVEFDAGHWKPGKKQLKAESFGKCAYCEAPTTVVAHGDVEHFRPKNVYWWLAYCYDNHLFACQICNQSQERPLPRLRQADEHSRSAPESHHWLHARGGRAVWSGSAPGGSRA
jgi:5-methylcytosine-specific restriction endonuclease McrA